MTHATHAEATKHHRACNLCEALCGLEITVHNGRVTDLRGDPLDPLSRGHICPKATALLDVHADPDRLKRPVRRVRTSAGDTWEEISWDEALAYAAEGLRATQERHGRDAVAIYQGNPSVHNSGTMLSAGGVWRALGTRNRYSATSVDQLPHHYAAWQMLGHPLLMPIPDVDRTQYLLVLGANPLASNGSILTAPGMKRRLQGIRERGGRVVLLDPRRTETAGVADAHVFIRPGTDAAWLLAVLHVIFAERLARPARLAEFTDGLGELEAVTLDFTPERVADFTGVPASVTRRVAREFAQAERAVCYGRIGLSTQAFGGLSQWLVNALNVATGNFDREGGMMFPQPAFDLLARAKRGENVMGRWTSRVRGLPEFDGELPVSTLADEILTPGDGQVRALVTSCGNPVLSTPNGARLDAALGGLDFMVAVDIYINETTRHANVILPPATGLEVEHYDVIFHHFAVRNTARVNLPVLPIHEDQRYDWQIFEGLRQRLTGDAGEARDPRDRLDLGLRHGPRRTSLAELARHPHGVDHGPLTPALPERLKTASGRLNVAPDPLLRDVQRLRAAMREPTPDLVLIGRRELRSNNSWMHNSPRLMRGPDRCVLLVHPADATRAGVRDGETVTVRSRIGEVTVAARVTDDVMPGVACLPHGYGHAREGVRQRTARARAGVSHNDLTDHERLDALTGNAALVGVPVTLHPSLPAHTEGEPHEVTTGGHA